MLCLLMFSLLSTSLPPSLPPSLSVNGNSKVVSVKNLTTKEIADHVSILRTSSGIKVTKLKKPWHTDNPTIQGNWNPFLNS